MWVIEVPMNKNFDITDPRMYILLEATDNRDSNVNGYTIVKHPGVALYMCIDSELHE